MNPTASASFRVLVICTGNLCRSPLVESLLTDRLATLPSVLVTSRGTRAVVGSPAPSSMGAAAAEIGANLSEHLSQPLTPADIDGADLILGLAREHRRDVALISPRAIRRTFTLVEFSRLIEGLASTAGSGNGDSRPSAEALRECVRAATARRGHIKPPLNPAELDVVDPYGLSDAVYRKCAGTIVDACGPISNYLLSAGG